MNDSPKTYSQSSLETLQEWRRGSRRLTGKAVFLEPLNETHLTPAYVSWLNDPEVTRYTRHGGSFYTLEKAREYLSGVKDSSVTLVFAIHRHFDGRHVGNISLNDISWLHHSGEISMIVGERECWGKGLGTEAVRLVADFAFEVLDLHRVFIGMTVDNAGMIAVAKKTGFVHEATLRHCFFKDGCYKDITQWYRLNPKHGGTDK